MPKDGTTWQWRQLTWLWLTATVALLDQWSKNAVEGSLALYERIQVLPIFNITLAYNEGAAFSFLAGAGGWQRWFFTMIAVFASLLIAFWLVHKKESRWALAGLTLVLGGAIGNLWDRLAHGHVVDFLDFHWAGYHFPAFNIADSAITVGAALLIIDMLFIKESADV